MASRKSSILKPRKIREPLQDLNQLLPSNEDEETTLAETQRRRVSFASMNKVKEFEAAAECVTLLNTPAYDERFSISSDSYQSSVSGVIHNDTGNQVNTSIHSRKSIQTTFKAVTLKPAAVLEDAHLDEDIELTETIGRIYDTPMKSSGDSSMEITHALSQNISSCSVEPEIVCPLNLTKESNRTHNFPPDHFIEVEVVDKSEKSYSNSSRMETTEVMGENLITEEKACSDVLSMETTQVIATDSNKNEKSDGNTSSMEITEVVCEDSVLIKSQSLCYETLQFNTEDCEIENLCEELEFVPVTNTSPNELIPPRKSIFEMSCPKSMTLNNWRASSLLDNKTKCNNSSMQLLSQPGEKTKYDNCSMQLMSQPDEQTKHHDFSMQVLSQPGEKTKYHDCSMELLSQETVNESKSNIPSKILTQESENGMKNNNLSVRFLSQETENKTNHNQSSMDLVSQETADKTKNDEDVQPNLVKEILNLSSIEDETRRVTLSADTGSAPKPESNREEKLDDHVASTEISPSKCATPTNDIENEDAHKEYEPQNEITQKSISDHNSSGNDSNSPLTVGVNFSIFQKNKETRVEFSGTIDSNKKKKSISNVQVNIINNKTEKKGRNVKELRFSMPATSKIGPDNVDRPDFSATFTDFNTPSEEEKVKLLAHAEVKNREETGSEFVEQFSRAKSDKCSSVTSSAVVSDLMSLQLTKPAVKRLSSEAFDDKEDSNGGSSPKRPSLTNDLQDSSKAELPSKEDNDLRVNRSSFISENVTEITEKRQSFVREEKSSVTVNNNVIIETHTKSMNMNVSFERSVISSSSSSSSANCEETSAGAVAEVQKSQITNSRSSATFLSKSVSVLEDKVCSPELRIENGSDASFTPTHSTPFRRSNTTNQSVNYEDEMSDNSLHNPSIMVMVGDSFSRYRSMDLGNENVSVCEGRNSQEPETDLQNLIFATDNISKENFVAEWLQNKTGKSNVDSRMLEKVGASRNGQILAPSISENIKEESSTNLRNHICGTSVAGDQNRESEIQCSYAKNDSKFLAEIEKIEKEAVVSKTVTQLDNCPVLATVNDQLKDALDECTSTEQIVAENEQCKNDDVEKSAVNTRIEIAIPDVQSLSDVHDEPKESLAVESEESECVISPLVRQVDSQNKIESNTDDFQNEELQNSLAVEARTELQQKSLEVKTDQEPETNIVPTEKDKTDDVPSKQQAPENVIETPRTPEIEKINIAIRSEYHDTAVPELSMETMPLDVTGKQISTKRESLIAVSDPTVTEARMEILPMKIKEKLNISLPNPDLLDEGKESPEAAVEDLQPIDMEIEDVVLQEDDMDKLAEMSIEEKFEEVKFACKNVFPADSMMQRNEDTTEKRRKMSPEFEKRESDNFTISEGALSSQIPEKPDMKSCANAINESKAERKSRNSLQEFVLEKIKNDLDYEQDWCIKSITSEKWVFAYLLGHMELAVTFADEGTNFDSTLRYVLPPKAKHYEIMKIAVHYLIRKYELKLNPLCRSVEDVPYLLKLINRDAIYARNFVIDVMKVGDSDGVKIKDGWATFYVSSYRLHLLLKIKVHIERLENLSVNDVNVYSVIGNVDVNSVRRVFSEVGRDYDFFSKFVKKMWSVFGSEKVQEQKTIPMEA